MGAVLTVAHIDLARGYKGNERQIELLIRELANIGVPQILVCRDDSPLPFHLNNIRGLKIQRIHGLGDPRFSGHFRLARRYKIIHAHEPQAMQWAFIHYIMFAVPYVITTRFALYPRGFFIRAVFNSAAKIIGVSKAICSEFTKNYRVDCSYIADCASHSKPDYPMVQRYRQALKNRFVVGMIAPLINRRNGQSVLIDAARLLHTRLPELILIFVGSGDDLRLLRQHAKGMPNVKFIGFKRNFIDYLAIFDVLALPVNKEVSGNILLDSMEQSIPVVGSNIGSIPDLIKDGESGLLIEPGDAEQLAEAILKYKKQPEFRQKVIENGYAVVEEHNSGAMAARYYREYMEITNR